ncbi:MAG: type II toxin-antitoxin system VapC family toxin [Vulcanimicrobiaceae bacterium]
MKKPKLQVTYWDTSAVVSALFADDHSSQAMRCARASGTHLVSSLAWAEANAVIARIERERMLADVLVAAAREALAEGPWRRLHLEPDWSELERLARAWPLRGADLWHLATAKALQIDLPELSFLCFDSRLAAAARGAGLPAPTPA